MLIQRYNYHNIARVTIDGKRHYATPTGENLPSVTTILDKTKPQEKIDALNNWRKRVGYQQAQTITTEAAGVGTVMHKMLEEHCKGEARPVGSNQVQQIARKMADTVITNGLANMTEVWGLEVPLYYPGLYAGTTDLVGCWKGDPAIGDFKQTNKPKKREWIDDYFLQLSAYIMAHDELYGTTIPRGVVLMCSRACEYQEFILEGDELEKYKAHWIDRVEQYYKL